MRWVEDQDRTHQNEPIDWRRFKNADTYDKDELIKYWILWRKSKSTIINPVSQPTKNNIDTIQGLLREIYGINKGTMMAFLKYQGTTSTTFSVEDQWEDFKIYQAKKTVRDINGLKEQDLPPMLFNQFLVDSKLTVAELLNPTTEIKIKIKNAGLLTIKMANIKKLTHELNIHNKQTVNKDEVVRFLEYLQDRQINFNTLTTHEVFTMYQTFETRHSATGTLGLRDIEHAYWRQELGRRPVKKRHVTIEPPLRKGPPEEQNEGWLSNVWKGLTNLSCNCIPQQR